MNGRTIRADGPCYALTVSAEDEHGRRAARRVGARWLPAGRSRSGVYGPCWILHVADHGAGADVGALLAVTEHGFTADPETARLIDVRTRDARAANVPSVPALDGSRFRVPFLCCPDRYALVRLAGGKRLCRGCGSGMEVTCVPAVRRRRLGPDEVAALVREREDRRDAAIRRRLVAEGFVPADGRAPRVFGMVAAAALAFGLAGPADAGAPPITVSAGYRCDGRGVCVGQLRAVLPPAAAGQVAPDVVARGRVVSVRVRWRQAPLHPIPLTRARR